MLARRCAFLFRLLVAFFVMSEVAVSLLSDASEAKMQNEFMILMLLVLAYFLGFANARERKKTAPDPKLKAMGMSKSHSMSHGKNATPDGGHPSKKLGLSAQAQSLRDNRGAALGGAGLAGTAAAGSTASPLDEGEAAALKLTQNVKRSQQWEADLRTIEIARKEGITSSAYAAVMGACSRCNDKDMALELINHMLAKGVAADPANVELGSNCNGPAAKFLKLVAENLDENRVVLYKKSKQLGQGYYVVEISSNN